MYISGAWQVNQFTERSISLAGLTANTNYDVWIYDNSGTITLELLAWASATARATALAYQDGILVKSGDATRRYLGTIRITASTGQCEDALTKRYVFNYYNQVRRRLYKEVFSGGHTYNSATFRAYNNSSASRVEFVIGVAEDLLLVGVLARARISNASYRWRVGAEIDATTTLSSPYLVQGSTNTADAELQASQHLLELVGYHYISMVEAVSNAAATMTSDMGLLTVSYPG
jgi:hypothetical protein